MISTYLQSAQYSDTPFPHVLSPCGLAPNDAQRILDWLESAAPWMLVEASFYEQYEFSLRDVDLPLDVAPLVSVKLLTQLKGEYKIKYVLGHKDIAPGRKDDPWGFDNSLLVK